MIAPMTKSQYNTSLTRSQEEFDLENKIREKDKTVSIKDIYRAGLKAYSEKLFPPENKTQ